MKKYIGVKMIEAAPMTRGDYNKYRGWVIPKDENPKDEGYLVKYSDSYESWSPKEAFEESYCEVQEEGCRRIEITYVPTPKVPQISINWVK
jgi:hypothetical protein